MVQTMPRVTPTRPAPQTAPSRSWRPGKKVIATSVFVASLVVLVVIWWAVVRLTNIQSYILPSPRQVWDALWPGITADPTSSTSLLFQFWITFKAALIGLAIGSVGGALVGMIAAQFTWIERVLMPYVFALQTTPKVAIAPLLMIWFGFGLTSEAFLAGTLAFFPLVVNTFTGMNLVDRERMRLFKALRASRLDIMFRLRMMTALPLILAGFEMAVVQALLGAVVAEFIAGQAGIGTLIVQQQSVSNTPGVFASIIVLALAGIILHAIVKAVRVRLVFWQRAQG
jgi:NitT/TauT family transport system permease protein